MPSERRGDREKLMHLAAEGFGPVRPVRTFCPDLSDEDRERICYDIALHSLGGDYYVRRVWEAVMRARARGGYDLTEIEAELEAASPGAGAFAARMFERMPDEPPLMYGAPLRRPDEPQAVDVSADAEPNCPTKVPFRDRAT